MSHPVDDVFPQLDAVNPQPIQLFVLQLDHLQTQLPQMSHTHRLGAIQMQPRRIVVIRYVDEQRCINVPIRVHIEAPQLSHASRMNEHIDDVQRIQRQLLMDDVSTELRLSTGDQRPNIGQLLDNALDPAILPDGLRRMIAGQHRPVVVGAFDGHCRVEELEVGAQLRMLGERCPGVQTIEKVRVEDALDKIQRISTEVDTGEHHIDSIAGGQSVQVLIDVQFDGLPKADAVRRLVVELAEGPENGTQQIRMEVGGVDDEEFTASVQNVWIAQSMGGTVLENGGDQRVLLDFDALCFDVSFEGFFQLFVAEVELRECGEDSGELRFVDCMDVGVQPTGYGLEAPGRWDVARAEDLHDFVDCRWSQAPEDGADATLKHAHDHSTTDSKSGQNGVDEFDVVLVDVTVLIGQGGPEFLGRRHLAGGSELVDGFADFHDRQTVG